MFTHIVFMDIDFDKQPSDLAATTGGFYFTVNFYFDSLA